LLYFKINFQVKHMKNLFIALLIAMALVGCKSENNTTITEPAAIVDPITPGDPTEPEDPEEPDPPEDPPVVTDPISPSAFAMSSSGPNGIKFHDGQDWYPVSYEKQAAPSKYMLGDQIFTLDEFGAELSFIYAPEQGDIVRETSSGTYLCDVMPPDESAALGALPRTYSQIWHYNGATWAEISHWSTREWECSDIFETESGEIIIRDTPLGRLYALSGAVVQSAQDNGLLITGYDGVNKRATFSTAQGSTIELWATNYMSSAKDWVNLGGTYYSYNGYEYSPGGGLIESANALSGFQASPYPLTLPAGESPTMVALGSDPAIGVVYFIESNSGWLVEFRAGTNQLSITKRLFIGDGMKQSGIAAAKKLNPYLLDGVVYYNHAGSVMSLDLATGGVNVFLAEDAEVGGY
jgi:hypothetical protein